MITFLIALVLLFLSGFAFGEAENILMYQADHFWRPRPVFYFIPWYSERNYLYSKLLKESPQNFLKKILLFLLKYPFSFFKSGFHFCKSTSIVLFIISINLLDFPLMHSILLSYFIYGIGFNSGYHT